MDFSKVDWMHTLGVGLAVGVGGAALLATLPVTGPLAALTAMGVTLSAGTIGTGPTGPKRWSKPCICPGRGRVGRLF